MRSKNRLLSIMLLALFGVLTSTIALRSIAIYKYFDANSGYFTNDLLLNISNFILISAVVIFVLYTLFKKNTKLKAEFDTPAITVTSGVCAISSIIFSVKMFENFALICENQTEGTSIFKNPVAIVALLCGIFGIASCAHFFLNMMTTHRVAVLRSYAAMGSVIFLALYASFLYFNTNFALNSPNKIIDQMAFLLTAVFFLYETRISLGIDKWNVYTTSGLIAAVLIGYSAIPSLIMYFVRGIVISNSIEESIFMLTLFIYITARLFICLFLPRDEESQLIASFSKFANEQDQRIEENDMLYKEKYAVQMSIEDLLDISEADNANPDTQNEPQPFEPAEEEYMQESFFVSELPPTDETSEVLIDSVSSEDEVNYEENSGN